MADIPVRALVVARSGSRWVDTTSSRPDLLDQAFDIADEQPDGWIAVVVGGPLDELERVVPSLWPPLPPGSADAEDVTGGERALLGRLGRAAYRIAAESTDRQRVAFVLADASLREALIGGGDDRLAVVRSELLGGFGGFLTLPGVDPSVPPDWWSRDKVRRREEEMRPGATGEMAWFHLGFEVLMAIAEDGHSGWVILPSTPNQAWLERAGFVIEERLAGDPLFFIARLPDGWTLVRELKTGWLKLVDRSGQKQATVFYLHLPENHYEEVSATRFAFMEPVAR